MTKNQVNTKLKRDDTVKILTGKDKGKTGKILRIDRNRGRVYIQGLNMVKKAVRPKSQQEKGGIIEIEAAVALSNVAAVTKNGEATRIGYKIENGKKIRIAKKTGEEL
ncbi:MAG: 50S ribosomal protein L24 [Spirochaetaceae bacterium]|nr:50S ribosomal protein L24 [Spirochaetaceae bacterium]MCF7947906.1 50S ribosomal protein L24 [Spirochaetia bacterium]MCF7950652.1 50S ribosomal protein L24 [Spirochaetaceae bacterium]